ncbi:hypothetical protein HHK36_033334 [Tetracentron sinense]|uniref:Trichome birefringence-like N-terminal domain-containing protein n=1 Tax=Tetracentron sinense TaxID=13715 RepID=A0A835CZK6_TETSI|nr:hypothetical protein HHK36_033334 [Tetracentron sinense]
MKLPISSSTSLRNARVSPYFLTVLAFIAFVSLLYGEDLSFLLRQSLQLQPESELQEPEGRAQVPFAVGEIEEGCDVYSGRWVRDESTRPLYDESECPYIQPQLTCQEHGRPDKWYQQWRWQPHGCSLPSFNATLMLEKLRGKRMMFVGDSLNRGQYVSLVCLLHSTIPDNAKSMQTFDSLTVFRAEEYNATIEFYWAPFLLESNSDDAIVHRVTDRIVREGSINKHGSHWEGADILVFNTYLWWMTGLKMKILRGSFKDEMKDIVEMKTEDAYRMAMKSMVKWVQNNMDPNKTRVFFTSLSPSHGKSVDWGGDLDGNCYNQTTPIEDLTYWGTGSRKSIMQVIGEVFRMSKVHGIPTPVSLAACKTNLWYIKGMQDNDIFIHLLTNVSLLGIHTVIELVEYIAAAYCATQAVWLRHMLIPSDQRLKSPAILPSGELQTDISRVIIQTLTLSHLVSAVLDLEIPDIFLRSPSLFSQWLLIFSLLSSSSTPIITGSSSASSSLHFPGILYHGNVPSNLTGIEISAMRLRSDSLRTRGVKGYNEFEIPEGVVVQPYVERLVLVYQNLGNEVDGFVLCRMMPLLVKSSAELEEEMMAKIPKFKARPVNKKIMEAPTLPALPRSTPQLPEFQEFHLKTMERANQHAETSTVVSSTDASCQRPLAFKNHYFLNSGILEFVERFQSECRVFFKCFQYTQIGGEKGLAKPQGEGDGAVVRRSIGRFRDCYIHVTGISRFHDTARNSEFVAPSRHWTLLRPIKTRLQLDFNKNQLVEKLRRLKKKFRNVLVGLALVKTSPLRAPTIRQRLRSLARSGATLAEAEALKKADWKKMKETLRTSTAASTISIMKLSCKQSKVSWI